MKMMSTNTSFGNGDQVLEVQIPGKRVVDATAFWNGLQGQQLKLQ